MSSSDVGVLDKCMMPTNLLTTLPAGATALELARQTGMDVSASYDLDLKRYGQWVFMIGVNFSDTEITHYNSTPSQLLALGQPYFDAYARNTLLHSAP